MVMTPQEKSAFLTRPQLKAYLQKAQVIAERYERKAPGSRKLEIDQALGLTAISKKHADEVLRLLTNGVAFQEVQLPNPQNHLRRIERRAALIRASFKHHLRRAGRHLSTTKDIAKVIEQL